MLNDDWRRELLGQGFKYQTRNACKALLKAKEENLSWEYIEEQIKNKKFHKGEGRVYCEFARLMRGEVSENFAKSLAI